MDFAENMKEDLNSFHFLLSSFVTPSEVAVLLEDMGIAPEMITSGYKEMKKRAVKQSLSMKEPDGTIKIIEDKAVSLLQSQDDIPSALHFFCAITNARNSLAYKILSDASVLTDVRLKAFNMLATPARRIKARKEEMQQESTKILPEQGSVTKTAVQEPSPDNGYIDHAPEKEESEKSQKSSQQIVTGDSNIELPEIFNSMGRNLTALAVSGTLEPIYGRESEIDSILDILCRKKNNNPCIIGPAGSGKTALVEGIAGRQKDGLLPGKIIWELNLPSLISGTEFRGSLEKRLNELLTETERYKDSIIVFIDEVHLMNSDQNELMANMLKPALSRGNFPLIGATTTDEFKKYIAKDPALERRFSLVTIEEPAGEELFRIAYHATETLSSFHNVKMHEKDLVKYAIRLSNRYISGKSQPDKVLSVLDTLGAVLSRNGKGVAEKNDLMVLVSNQTGIPVENLLVDGTAILRMLPDRMNRSIKGQHKAKKKVCQLLARRFIRKNDNKPISSFLFAGPTGVGKTEMAKKLAEFFFGSEKKLVSFDMSEFQEQHSISRLIGAPPGYTGFEDGGQLTEAFRREPYQLLLLDEIEKAHPKVLTILLQILEEGRVSDSRGFSVNMSETIIVMTTNLGAEEFGSSRVGFGGGTSEDVRENLILSKIESFLSPEIINRVDEVVIFTPFTDEEMKEIAGAVLDRVIRNLAESYGITIETENREEISAYLVDSMTGKEKSLGARAVNRIVEKKIEGLVLDHMYSGKEGSHLKITFDSDINSVQVSISSPC